MGIRGVRLPDQGEFRGEGTISSASLGCSCPRPTSFPNVRRRLGMDAQRLRALPWLSRRIWGTRRIQRQIHVQPICSSRRFLRHLAHSYSPDLSQLLLTGKTLAIHRGPTRARPSMNNELGRTALLDLDPAKSDFISETIVGLSSSLRILPCKFFYDECGARLFQKI